MHYHSVYWGEPSEPHTSVTALEEVVCMYVCMYVCMFAAIYRKFQMSIFKSFMKTFHACDMLSPLLRR